MIINANALHIPLADETVQCVVTSPPYWGLRDYGTAKWEGGDPECDHAVRSDPHVESSTLAGGKGSTGHQREGYKTVCGKCGARRLDAQLGLEPTPEEYVANMVAVFREVWRVMRDDGTLWLNIGDSYAGSWGNYAPGGIKGEQREQTEGGERWERKAYGDTKRLPPTAKVNGLKPKDLVGIPWRLAFALQGFAVISIDQIASLCKAIDSRDLPALDWFRAGFKLWEELAGMGWYYNRSDIIWSKPNPMPESVTDRPTKAHEYIFLLTKAANYYYDAEAVREAAEYGYRPTKGDGIFKRVGNDKSQPERTASTTYGGDGGTRNRRTVWTIPTSPYSGSHFATFPPDLVRPCILAGSSPRACEHCGAPWERVVERGELVKDDGTPAKLVNPLKRDGSLSAWSRPGGKVETVVPNSHIEKTTTGWRSTCKCDNQGTGRSIVLDPFAGTFTVGMVAAEYGRRAVGIELNPEYIKLARERTAQAMAQQVMPL